MYYGEGGPRPKGSFMMATFQLDGVEFIVLNGGPEFTFSSAISFFVKCETQSEIDGYWEKLSEGGEPLQCGWLKDKFGVTWQIVPNALTEMLQDPNPAKTSAIMKAMLKMVKLDIEALKQAYEQG
jgi:predicted 3-demethylubiquinone-9 3-methyltransferase (glyoxalase superfamily)